MKTYHNCLILSIIIILIFCGCTNKTENKIERLYNGIDSQILDIVDSIQICCKESPFIIISFLRCDENNCVVSINEGLFIPVPPMPSKPFKQILISEMDDFLGYKKYNDTYLLFVESYPNNVYFDRFVEKDSLCIDEEPFRKFSIYDLSERMCVDCRHKEKRYLINEKDSLVLYTGKCLFDNIE